MLNKIVRCILYLSFTVSFTNWASQPVLAKADHRITHYQAIFEIVCDKKNNLVIAIRSYYRGAHYYFLAVNPDTFATTTAPADHFKAPKIATEAEKVNHGYFSLQALQHTPYIQALNQYAQPPYVLQNYGLTRAAHPTTGRFLTIDLCPSKKHFEERFFNKLIQQHPSIPVAIAISGSWIQSHPKSFNWLVKQADAGTLQITWINHSFTHPYHPKLSLEKNFLLRPELNIDQEILATEQLLLTNNQLPSVFFRFPGLVSNQTLVKKLSQFSLIPIGSSAWLAKGEPANPGAIILVHGNANEPVGITKLLPLLERPDIHWLPLNQAF